MASANYVTHTIPAISNRIEQTDTGELRPPLRVILHLLAKRAGLMAKEFDMGNHPHYGKWRYLNEDSYQFSGGVLTNGLIQNLHPHFREQEHTIEQTIFNHRIRMECHYFAIRVIQASPEGELGAPAHQLFSDAKAMKNLKMMYPELYDQLQMSTIFQDVAERLGGDAMTRNLTYAYCKLFLDVNVNKEDPVQIGGFLAPFDHKEVYQPTIFHADAIDIEGCIDKIDVIYKEALLCSQEQRHQYAALLTYCLSWVAPFCGGNGWVLRDLQKVVYQFHGDHQVQTEQQMHLALGCLLPTEFIRMCEAAI